jgi:hypothetical protein
MACQPVVGDARVAVVSLRLSPVKVFETMTSPVSAHTRRAPSLEARYRVYVALGYGTSR